MYATAIPLGSFSHSFHQSNMAVRTFSLVARGTSAAAAVSSGSACISVWEGDSSRRMVATGASGLLKVSRSHLANAKAPATGVSTWTRPSLNSSALGLAPFDGRFTYWLTPTTRAWVRPAAGEAWVERSTHTVMTCPSSGRRVAPRNRPRGRPGGRSREQLPGQTGVAGGNRSLFGGTQALYAALRAALGSFRFQRRRQGPPP